MTDKQAVKRIDPDTLPRSTGTNYPAPFNAPCQRRERIRLGDAADLSQFGVNQLRLSPGTWSSQRHWHSHEDEFVYVLQGEVVLVTEQGEEVLRAGDCTGFRAGVANGHHLQNRSQADAVVLEVGSRDPDHDAVDYPDIDMVCVPVESAHGYTHRDGTPYPE